MRVLMMSFVASLALALMSMGKAEAQTTGNCGCNNPGYVNQGATVYSSGPYEYTTGYRGYYSPVFQDGYYYGQGGYYGQTEFSGGFGYGRRSRGRW